MRTRGRVMTEPCPTPTKQRFPDAYAASRALSRMREKGRKEAAHYLCRCGGWHVTSRGGMPG